MTRTTLHTLQAHKDAGRPITMVTAYDYPTARLIEAMPADDAVDVVLVGDSLGMAVLGYESTIRVTLDDMVHHSAAVARGTERALVLTDMPFLSYHVDPAETVHNAGRLVQAGGAQAVKMEGGRRIIPHIRAVLDAQIPVVGHLGLTPQSVIAMGGYRVQGRDCEAAEEILTDALALQEVGVAAIVLECVPAALGAEVTRALRIPTIGIGAGPDTDGQVLVLHDLVGLHTDVHARFVRRFGNAGAAMTDALTAYTRAVRSGNFPSAEHSY